MRRRFLARTSLLDFASLVFATVVASLFVFDHAVPWTVRSDIWPLLGFLFLGLLIGSYVSLRTWGNAVPRPSYARALTITIVTIGVAALAVVVFRSYWSRPFLGITAGTMLAVSLLHRAVSRTRPWTESMLLVTGEKQFPDHLRMAAHADVVDILDPRSEETPVPLEAGVTLAVDLRAVLSEPVAQFVASSNIAGYTIRSLANLYEEHTGRFAVVHLVDGWELSAPLERSATYIPVKRVIDFLLVLLTLPLWLALGVVIWTAIRLDSPGPAIFKQRRVGRNGEGFTLYKFRTMVLDAESSGPRFAEANDDRLTRVGRALRRFRVDEIPQLWNVLRGDLSLVGPRPERPEFVDAFSETIPFYAYRHLIRPGLTGWAQVNYGYADDEADTIEKLTYDLYYVKYMSLWLDFQVLGKSIWTVLSGFGAQ
jgi:exopolysaccharide biosynthesis polyprenyl glycosylphosphotransferase